MKCSDAVMQRTQAADRETPSGHTIGCPGGVSAGWNVKRKDKDMQKIAFNDNWICYRTGHKEEAFEVSIPHDAMLLDGKSENSPGGVNTGWYDAQDYTYEKKFTVPAEWKGQKLFFEFEGVYRKATVFLNGKKAAYHTYGYTGFYVDDTENIKFDMENELRVEVINSDQPNSRWYSGTGIYRPVWFCAVPEKHMKRDSIKITTLDYKNPKIQIEAKTTAAGMIKVEILDYVPGESHAAKDMKGQADVCIAEVSGETAGNFHCEMDLPGAKTWSPEHPSLYTCRVSFEEDIQEENFGIRVIECTPEKGFCINGKRVILRGACIHHDNGILGACAYDFAERRKIRLLKENGYNAVRSAHNPCSKAMLSACDEMGMLMVDEYVDVWYIHKTKYDYASEVMTNYRDDLRRIVDKDYNHPSVIMYSTGNEVSETAQKKGIEFCGKLTKCLHKLDSTRPVTCGINIFFNFLSSMGFGVYSDKKAEQAVADAKKKKAVGSEFFNTIAGIFGANFMKSGATLYPCDLKTRDAFARMDVAGYNYGIFRYQHDLKKYPKRMILGSETFCADAYRFWQEAKRDKRLIGDFVWAGMDYLGEVGIGSWEYKNYAPRFDNGMGWVSAGSGRIDLTGKPLAEMKYTRVAFEQEKIGIGVVPVNCAGQKHSPSAWKMSNAVESWSWNGCESMETKVEVYARASYVKLFINGKCVGQKRPKGDCKVIFDTKYQDGTVKAVAFDSQGKVIAQTSMKTAGEETILTLEPEQKEVKNESELCYVRLKYTDKNGEVKPLARGEIKVNVEGGKLLGLGSACPYYTKSYLGTVSDTYFGEALAVIRPESDKQVVVKAESKYGNAEAVISVIRESVEAEKQMGIQTEDTGQVKKNG